MKILIIKLSAIGDVVQTLPALEAIKKLYPESGITWLVEEAAAGILEEHPLIDELLISRRKTWIRMLKSPFTFTRGIVNIIRFLREVRRIQYDIAIDFQGLLKSGLLISVARAGRKIGFDRTREFSSFFLNERLSPYDIEKHALQRYLDVARYLGAKEPSADCTLPIERERLLVGQKIKAINPHNRPLVVINPAARWKTKLWPEKKFAELADILARERRAFIIFTGSREDGPMTMSILAMMTESAQNWSGETTLKELAALAAYADLFITTDTGPMHLAAAAGTKVLALFGPTAPWRTGPYGTGHIVLRTGIDCSPCFKRECRDIRCMKELTPDMVMEKIILERAYQ